jgi:ABC-type multidrug transport system ATPase subunit
VTDEIAVEADDLGRSWGGRWVLSGLNLRVRSGQGLLVVGRNGAGKTTLLRILATALPRSHGRLRLFGQDPEEAVQAARLRVGYLGHEGGLWSELDAPAHLRTWAGLLGRPVPGDLLDRLGLDAAGDRPSRVFSAGMRRRLALCRLLIEVPDLILLDEPYSHLDPVGFALIDGLIDGWRKEGRSVVVTSHHVARLHGRLDHGLLLDGGRPVWAGAGHELPALLEQRWGTGPDA